MQTPHARAFAKPHGFSLLELITAMTITAMVVTILYWAFAMGSRVWETQDDKTSAVQREEALLRLLDQDLRGIVPYAARWERGEMFFFAGALKALFYVTRGGFGAQAREEKALFFACLFVSPNPERGWDVALYKTPVPSPELLEILHLFQTGGEIARRDWHPSPSLMDHAVVFLKQLDDVSFSYFRESPHPFQGTTMHTGAKEGVFALEDRLEEWLEPDFPGVIFVRYEREGKLTEISLIPRLGAL